MNNTTFKDHFNQDVQVGDIITYPVGQGSSLWLSVAKVKKIEKTIKTDWNDKEYEVSNISVIVISEYFDYSEREYDLKSKYHKFVIENVPNNWKTCYLKYPRKVRINTTENKIKIPESYLTDVQKKVLLNEEWAIDSLKTHDE